MASPTREEVYEALLTLLRAALLEQNGGLFHVVTRRYQPPQDDPKASPALKPTLYQYEGLTERTEYKGSRGLPKIRTWNLMLIVYAQIPGGIQNAYVPDKTTPGSTVLNPLIDAVEDALTPAPTDEGVQTLGDLVIDCRIEGETIRQLGDQDPSGLCTAVIPVSILVQ